MLFNTRTNNIFGNVCVTVYTFPYLIFSIVFELTTTADNDCDTDTNNKPSTNSFKHKSSTNVSNWFGRVTIDRIIKIETVVDPKAE